MVRHRFPLCDLGLHVVHYPDSLCHPLGNRRQGYSGNARIRPGVSGGHHMGREQSELRDTASYLGDAI